MGATRSVSYFVFLPLFKLENKVFEKFQGKTHWLAELVSNPRGFLNFVPETTLIFHKYQDTVFEKVRQKNVEFLKWPFENSIKEHLEKRLKELGSRKSLVILDDFQVHVKFARNRPFLSSERIVASACGPLDEN
ncbi:MAG: hypothetical protein GY820_01930 [Gammaproteobacteria bacterium]|nr:hypothetical protein [Gammaproteobacteria bacterium]